jgi:integrase
MSRGTRTRVATGVYRDAFGYAVCVWVPGRGNVEERYPASATIPELIRARPALRAKHTGPGAPVAVSRHKRTGRGEVVAPVATGPTLAEGLEAFVATLPKGSTNRANNEWLGAWWVKALGAGTALMTITGARVLEVFAEWKAEHTRTGRGHSASTLNKRRDCLRGIYRVVFGAGGINPTAELGPREEEVSKLEERSIPRTAVEYLFAAMPDRGRPQDGRPRAAPNKRGDVVECPTVSLSKIRLRVMVETGFTPAMLKRLEPRHVKYRERECYIAGRFKGKKSIAPRWVPITTRGADALRAFFAHGASGPSWSTSSTWKTYRLAVAAAKPVYEREERLTWPAPENARPYDLRHCFASDYYEETGDEQALKYVLMHSPTSTVTARYINARVAGNAAKGRDRLQSAHAVIRDISALFSAPGQNIKENA